jgi:drug/metabolite transporter (DMT)-like permease
MVEGRSVGMATTIDSARAADGVRGSNARGIAGMLFAMACFVSSDTLIKVLGRDLPVGQIMFLRGLFTIALIAGLAAATGVLTQIRSALTTMVAARTFAEVGATVFFFTGLVSMPFSDAAAIGQFTPLAVTAAAAVFLQEPVGWRRWLATTIGLIGVLLIIRPGAGAFNPAAILIVICVGFVVARDLLTRMLGSGIPALLLILVSATATTFTGLATSVLGDWIMPDGTMIGSLAISALGVSGGYYGSIVAMRCGEISVVSPFRYASMLFALMWGYVIFSEVPDRLTWAGIVIVIGAGIYMFHREGVRKRETAAAGR